MFIFIQDTSLASLRLRLEIFKIRIKIPSAKRYK